MSAPLTLRPYQERALSDLWNWFGENTGNPLVVLPTGAGKSLVIAEWCKLVFETDPTACILVVTHVRELVQQNALELVGLWPEARGASTPPASAAATSPRRCCSPRSSRSTRRPTRCPAGSTW